MKIITCVFALTIIILLTSCEQANEKKTVRTNQTDSTKLVVEKKAAQMRQNRQRVEEQERIDSINDAQILSDAIKIAEQLRAQDRFRKNYVAAPDSSYGVEVDISSDFYFSRQSPHLIIRRKTPSSVYIDIFSKTNKEFHRVLSHEQWTLEYMSDNIRDINGDGLKDFVVNWYGSTGCCLKGFSNIYLLRSDQKSFSNSFEFINPTFSPKERIIRGVCYGHPGETEMYKYKWNKEAVDTIEYVYYEKDSKGEKTGKLIVSNTLPDRVNQNILRRLSYVPVEYRKIVGYDWFTDNLEENGNR